ncbi:MAG: hypothetical protein JSS02_02800 [Planctomycetes bacterium]|nr:hypothetical protein [Planctomycetota bacterium]
MNTPSTASDSRESAASVTPPQNSRPPRRRLSMSLINFWLDASLLVTIGFIGWVSVVMRVVFPAPTHSEGWTLWGMSFDRWHDLQFGSICFCALVILLHIMLHWNWVCNVIAAQVLRLKSRPDDGMQTVYGVATMIGFLGLILAGLIAAVLTVKSP